MALRRDSIPSSACHNAWAALAPAAGRKFTREAIAGVYIHATAINNLLRGDADGVVVIPQEHEASVLACVEEIAAAEDNIRGAVRSGMRLDEARKQFRYHQLQTRKK